MPEIVPSVVSNVIPGGNEGYMVNDEGNPTHDCIVTAVSAMLGNAYVVMVLDEGYAHEYGAALLITHVELPGSDASSHAEKFPFIT